MRFTDEQHHFLLLCNCRTQSVRFEQLEFVLRAGHHESVTVHLQIGQRRFLHVRHRGNSIEHAQEVEQPGPRPVLHQQDSSVTMRADLRTHAGRPEIGLHVEFSSQLRHVSGMLEFHSGGFPGSPFNEPSLEFLGKWPPDIALASEQIAKETHVDNVPKLNRLGTRSFLDKRLHTERDAGRPRSIKTIYRRQSSLAISSLQVVEEVTGVIQEPVFPIRLVI